MRNERKTNIKQVSRYIKKSVCMLCAVMLMLPQFVWASENDDLQQKIQQTAEGLQSLSSERYMLTDENSVIAGYSGSDWIAMTLVFSGVEDAYEDYLKMLQAYVEEQYMANGCLDSFKATEYHRIALTMLSLGGDPTNVTVDGTTVDLVAEGTYNFHGETPGQQGSNGLSYALMTLDAKDYEVPENAKFTREGMIDELLSYQTDEGGFAMTGNISADLDITSMAVQALAPYMGDEKVSTAVKAALAWLSDQMTDAGTFSSYGSENAESVAQVILALCALGLDPEKETDFIKDGTTLLDGLNQFRCNDNMYMHLKGDDVSDGMATYQALLALEAVWQVRTQNTWILDFTAYAPENIGASETAENQFSEAKTMESAAIIIAGAIVIIAAGVIIAVCRKNRRSNSK